MMTAATLIAIGSLLGAPGPTNALFAASGAAVGVRRSLKLLPVGLAAYLVSIALLVANFGYEVARRPAVAILINLGAAIYLGWSAFRLWRSADTQMEAATPARTFLTTLLNPKTLIFAFVLYPNVDPMMALGIFVPGFTLSAMVWTLVGYAISIGSSRSLDNARISRATVVANLIFATIILGAQLQPLI